PPALPLTVAPVPAGRGPEHVAAHQAGADVLERLLDDARALVLLAARLVVRLAPCGERDDPVVQSLPALAERVLRALVRAGDVSVRRDGDVTPELAHHAAPWELGWSVSRERSVVVAAGAAADARHVGAVDVDRDRGLLARVVHAVDVAGRREAADVADVVG